MAEAIDVDSLYQASLTIVELACRLTEFLIDRSREVEDVTESQRDIEESLAYITKVSEE
ncbi:hypothetical protein SLS57_007801 [Botryosphaeria dothidea]